ncbi:MAG TPA: DUF2852 domain-containing protein [Methylocella sp.]|nr:DUF2852 domain-containing protein [Methylocella sp.]
MSADSGMAFQSSPNHAGEVQWRQCRRGQSWKFHEILAMVAGFMVFWPLGLAVIAWKFWQRRTGYRGDLLAFVREKLGRESLAEWKWPRNGFWHGSTGNRAFDEWRAGELARLEEEYRRLAAAEKEFAEHLENLRHAKDREEFERFMRERQNRNL